jgi:alpha-galactosidase
VISAPRTAAPTPPMGWNSWDCFGTSVTEDEVMRNAHYMADHLAGHGWDTVVVDIQWYEPTARAGGYNDDAPLVLDPWGRPLPAINRFPSAADGAGFAPLARRIHELGLRFGLHIMRGIPRRAVDANLPVLGTDVRAREIADPASTCDWNSDNVGIDHSRPGAQAYYDSLAALFAEWGVDYVKVDDMLGPYHAAEVAAFSGAIERSGRPMVVSMSPGQMLSTAHASELRRHADIWRVSADLWDRWSDLRGQFDRLAMWAPHCGDGGWADADMLPLGRVGTRAEEGPDRDSRLTLDEARTMMTLWVVARSPLMFGGDLPRTDSRTIALLTNDDVLKVLRATRHNRQVLRHKELVVWAAESSDSARRYAALFNTGDDPLDYAVPLTSVDVTSPATTTDLWTGDVTRPMTTITGTLAPHGSRLLALDAIPDLR